MPALPLGPNATLCPIGHAQEWALTGPLTSLHIFLTPLHKDTNGRFRKKSGYSPLAAPSLQYAGRHPPVLYNEPYLLLVG